jgi:alpha-1,2-mannosyltransferase
LYSSSHYYLYFRLEVCHLLENFPDCKIVIYTAEETTVHALTEKVYKQFGIRVVPKFSLVFLESAFLLEPTEYPWFTLLGQAIGSMFVTFEALLRYTPNCFVDTTGFPASMPVARFCFGCYVVCYVHYPTVSRDMLQVVQQRQVKYNNRSFIAKSYFATLCKLFYYRVSPTWLMESSFDHIIRYSCYYIIGLANVRT